MAIAAALRARGLFGTGEASDASRAEARAASSPAPAVRESSASALGMGGESASHPSCAAVPLAFAGPNADASVVSVRGSEEARRHLETLGFVEGARVKVVSEAAGNLIVEIKGSQVALDRQAAMKVSVSA